MLRKNECSKSVCQECGDVLIHQGKRGWRESSSAYGQHIRDDYATTFFFLDIDGCIYKVKTKVLRVIEHKRPTQSLKNSERDVLGLFAIAVDNLISREIVHPQSGVFVLYANDPWKDAVAMAIGSGQSRSAELSGRKLKQFETGEIMAEWPF